MELATATTATTSARAEASNIQASVLRLFAMVAEGIAAATACFLAGDRETARRLVAGDPLIDELQASIEEMVEHELDAPSRDPSDIRVLVSVLRVVPELERSGDLVEHIALRCQRGLLGELTPLARGLIGAMGGLGAEMWREAAAAWMARDAAAITRLRELDDQMDDLHVRLTAEMVACTVPTAAAIELGLVARFFERLGDHAVNVTRRIGYLAASAAGPR